MRHHFTILKVISEHKHHGRFNRPAPGFRRIEAIVKTWGKNGKLVTRHLDTKDGVTGFTKEIEKRHA